MPWSAPLGVKTRGSDRARLQPGIEERIATFESEPRTPADTERLLGERRERYQTVVVERGGEVVAWAGAGSYGSLCGRW